MLRESCAADALLEEARREIVRLTPVEAHELQLAGAIVIDIRSDAARERYGVVPGSVHIPRTVLEWRLDPTSPWANPHIDFDEGSPILLCDHGWSSSLAASTLRRLGHEGIGDVIGGFEEWCVAGLPVVHAEPERLAANELPGMAPPAGRPEPRKPTVEQKGHWESALGERRDRYGVAASEPARATLEALHHASAHDLLELGGGQGRDTLFFARAGLVVTAVDFAPTAVATIAEKARADGVAERVSLIECDVRRPLPIPDQSFDACYSHMLFCMALSESQLHSLASEVWRLLRPSGLCIYTARTTADPDYGRGTNLGGDLYELDGFVVHFFSPDLVDRIAVRSGVPSFELLEVAEFEEGNLPRRLVRVTMRRSS